MYSLFIKNYVDKEFAKSSIIDHESIANNFIKTLNTDFNDAELEKLLIVSGFIPDLYPNDSSQETLFSKLIEALVCVWANRISAKGTLIKQKASYEDIQISLNNSIIVCDAKSFRLGRSQQAPNAKDFLKLEDIRKWMSRYPNAIGGLVTYPCKHEWSGGSDIYQYCTTKEAPTIMLPYKYLALLLHFKDRYTLNELSTLWNYEDLFPEKLLKNMPGGNKSAYWEVINAAIAEIIKISVQELSLYMRDADVAIEQCVKDHKHLIEQLKVDTIKSIEYQINKENDIVKLKERIMEYQIYSETHDFDVLVERINKFRL